jgi:hypothetical protein
MNAGCLLILGLIDLIYLITGAWIWLFVPCGGCTVLIHGCCVANGPSKGAWVNMAIINYIIFFASWLFFWVFIWIGIGSFAVYVTFYNMAIDAVLMALALDSKLIGACQSEATLDSYKAVWSNNSGSGPGRTTTTTTTVVMRQDVEQPMMRQPAVVVATAAPQIVATPVYATPVVATAVVLKD